MIDISILIIGYRTVISILLLFFLHSTDLSIPFISMLHPHPYSHYNHFNCLFKIQIIPLQFPLDKHHFIPLHHPLPLIQKQQTD